jgi:hypothetical protein
MGVQIACRGIPRWFSRCRWSTQQLKFYTSDARFGALLQCLCNPVEAMHALPPLPVHSCCLVDFLLLDLLSYSLTLNLSGASGSASPATTHQDGCMSPHTGTNSHKQQQHRHHHKQHKQQRSSAPQQPSCSNSMPGHVIHPDELADEWVGCQVMVYWPADNRWWAATICGVSQYHAHNRHTVIFLLFIIIMLATRVAANGRSWKVSCMSCVSCLHPVTL